jgi:hypothetical protein
MILLGPADWKDAAAAQRIADFINENVHAAYPAICLKWSRAGCRGQWFYKGGRLPVETVVENVDAYMEMNGLSEEQAVDKTLESFSTVPGCADGIRAVLAYRDAHEHQLQP